MKETLLLFLCYSSLVSNIQSGSRVYKVIASRFSNSPIISKATGSAWDFCYNPAVYNYNNNINLIARCQNCKPDASNPYDVGPSYLSASQVTFNDSGFPFATPTMQILLGPNNTTEKCGLEDPRVAYLNDTYYMFYNAYDCSQVEISYAISNNPTTSDSWTRKGPTLPSNSNPELLFKSKHGAPLFATPENGLPTHLLYWVQGHAPPEIFITNSSDEMQWTDSRTILLHTRDDFFDSYLVYPGPPPIRLASGDYLFIYNSARHGYPSVRPGHDLQGNLGYVILNGSNPRYILQRSDEPILSPELEWEVGNSPEYLAPNTVYLAGLVADPNGCPANVGTLVGPEYANNAECFFGAYGAADSVIGAVRIVASWIIPTTANTTSSTFNAESSTVTSSTARTTSNQASATGNMPLSVLIVFIGVSLL